MSVRHLSKGRLRANQALKPRAPRVRTSLPAVLIDSDGGELLVDVINLSSGGFGLSAGEPLEVGEQVRLRVQRYGDFPAQLRWIEGNQAGGRFLEPVILTASGGSDG